MRMVGGVCLLICFYILFRASSLALHNFKVVFSRHRATRLPLIPCSCHYSSTQTHTHILYHTMESSTSKSLNVFLCVVYTVTKQTRFAYHFQVSASLFDNEASGMNFQCSAHIIINTNRPKDKHVKPRANVIIAPSAGPKSISSNPIKGRCRAEAPKAHYSASLLCPVCGSGSELFMFFWCIFTNVIF